MWLKTTQTVLEARKWGHGAHSASETLGRFLHAIPPSCVVIKPYSLSCSLITLIFTHFLIWLEIFRIFALFFVWLLDDLSCLFLLLRQGHTIAQAWIISVCHHVGTGLDFFLSFFYSSLPSFSSSFVMLGMEPRATCDRLMSSYWVMSLTIGLFFKLGMCICMFGACMCGCMDVRACVWRPEDKLRCSSGAAHLVLLVF